MLQRSQWQNHQDATHTHTLIWTMKHFFVRQRYSFLYPLLSAFFPESFLSLTPPPSVWPHLFRAAGREKRKLKWSLAFRLYIGSFPYAQLLGSVHTARLDRVCFLCILPRLVLCVLICDFWFVCVSPIFCVSLSSWVISLTVFGASITNLNEPPRALAASTIAWVRSSLLGRCKQKQRGLRGLLCRWSSITEWEMYIAAQGPRLRNDLHCVEWDVKLYYTIPFLSHNQWC